MVTKMNVSKDGGSPTRTARNERRRTIPVQKEPQAARQGLAVAAYAHLKQAIVECELAPGSFVSQAFLETTFKLSRAALRSALARLEQEELIRSIPRKGYVVSPFTIQDINEIFDIRRILEPAATRCAAGRLSETQIVHLCKLSSIGFQPGDRQSERAYLDANYRFHVTIAQAEGNKRLAALVGQIHDESTRMIFLTMSLRDYNAEWQERHEQIIEALACGDGALAEQRSRDEIEMGRQTVLRTLLSNPALTSVNLAPNSRRSPNALSFGS